MMSDRRLFLFFVLVLDVFPQFALIVVLPVPSGGHVEAPLEDEGARDDGQGERRRPLHHAVVQSQRKTHSVQKQAENANRRTLLL